MLLIEPHQSIKPMNGKAVSLAQPATRQPADVAAATPVVAAPDFTRSPVFPPTVYEALPRLLTDGCQAFQSQRERDVFFVSAVAVLSGCMPSVRGVYDGADVQANLFVFVVAPAGSGKGSLTWARMLGLAYHKARVEVSEQARQDYDQRAAEARTDKQPFLEHPPPYTPLFLPGNSSSAAFIKALKENGETGIICETEADTLSGALKQDWGDYSDLLRKAFHHESIGYLRKTGERYEIERPALSVVLAGTPGQVSKLIPNAENGLFSRFLFYCFENEPVWRDVSPVSGRPSLNDHFGRLSESVKTMALMLADTEPMVFALQPHHWKVLNQTCPLWLADAIDDTAKSFSGTVYRLGLVIYRLAMVLTILERYEAGSLTTSVVCQDSAFVTAMKMAQILLDHSKRMYGVMPRTGWGSTEPDKRSQFLTSLPDHFDRIQADAVGKQIGISERTVTNYLKRLVETGSILKTEHGKYQKT